MTTKKTTTSRTERGLPGQTLFGKLKGVVATGVLSFLFALQPVPAARPRVSRWGTYYPKGYTVWMKAATECISIKDMPPSPLLGPVAVFLEHIMERPKTTVRPVPRGDADNLAKGPLDVLTKHGQLWKDDDQVALLVSYKRYARPEEPPGTHIDVITLGEEA